MGRREIYQYALFSVLLTLLMALIWEFVLETDKLLPSDFAHLRESAASSWLHVALITAFSAMAVAVVTIFSQRLVNELKAKDRTLQKAEAERLSFAADAAHELRTPLSILRAHVDSLEDSEAIRQLREDVDHITRIVEQVLAKSRVEALDVKPDDEADLADVCHHMATYFAPLIVRDGRNIELIGADHPCPVNGNGFAIEQALRNLIENAIKYAARGSTITLRVERDGREARLCVQDRGRGVAESDREVIFERFHRADRRGSGSGLGLAIVRRVAESHGGRVSVADSPGGGAMFCLHFPLKQKKH